MKSSQRYSPEELFAKYRAIREKISDKEFFHSPKYQKAKECWCAAHFTRAYDRFVRPCSVLIDDTDTQTDVDFDLDLDNVVHPFQVTEVVEPGRRRGDEYSNGVPDRARADNIELGTELGADWVRAAIERKLKKRYANVSGLNLLAYLNFAGRDQKYVTLRDKCSDLANQFASVWLLGGNTLCCIKQNSLIPSWEGWMVIEESLASADA